MMSKGGQARRPEDKKVQTRRKLIEKAKQTRCVIMDEDTQELLPVYEAGLRAAGAVDFSDLVPMALELLARRPKLLESIRPQHVVVDESQDMSSPQRALALILAGADIYNEIDPASSGTTCGLTTVGDDDRMLHRLKLVCDNPARQH